MIHKIKTSCTGCHACSSICPVKAIKMEEDSEGFLYPKVDEEKCIKCGLCVKSCPVLSKYKSENFETPKVLAAWSLDEKNKFTSSSGGCFYEFAKYIINLDGVVIGAGFDDKLNVIHKSVTTTNKLSDLKGSKYVQSSIGNSYLEVRDNLKKGKYVLFVGTPCQVSGLYSFLKKINIDKLYTADVICHGVPSPKVYRKYLNELKEKFDSNIKSISFRDKTKGWKNFSMKVCFENSKFYIEDLKKDKFIQGFLKNIYLRPSCYSCKFSNIPRVADITLGDFWEIEKRDKKLDDDTGTSELLINSEKGKELLNKVKKNIYLKEVDLDYGIKVNPCLIGSVKKNKIRKKFFRDLDKLNFNQLSEKYFKDNNNISKIIGIAKRILHR